MEIAGMSNATYRIELRASGWAIVSHDGALVAIGFRNQGEAREFAKKEGIPL
jgi:chemotaxis receptor (MCP) glutamine deamidase CheD